MGCRKLKEVIRDLDHRCWTHQNDERKMRALMKNQCERHRANTKELSASGGRTDTSSNTTSARMTMLLENAMKMTDDDDDADTVVADDCVAHSTAVVVAETPPSIVDTDAFEDLELEARQVANDVEALSSTSCTDDDLSEDESSCFEMEGEICPSGHTDWRGVLSGETLDNILYHPLRLVALLTVLSHEPKKRSADLSCLPQDQEGCAAVPEMGTVPVTKGDDHPPGMIQSDSMMSCSSDYTLSTADSSGFLP